MLLPCLGLIIFKIGRGEVENSPVVVPFKMWFFLEIMDAATSGLNRRWTIRIVISTQLKSQHSWWKGGGLVNMALVSCTSAEWYIQVLEQNILPSRYLFRGRPCLYQQDNVKHHILHVLQQYGSILKRVRVLNGPVCSLDLSPTENIWRKNMTKEVAKCWVAKIVHQVSIGKYFSFKVAAVFLLSSKMLAGCYHKKRWCNTVVNMLLL